MKTLTLFGSSGRTGIEITELALEKGLRVNAFCRNKAVISAMNENLNIIEGNVLDFNSVKKAAEGTDYVVCALGTKPPYTDVFCYEAMKNIVVAMHENKVKRLICITGAMIGDYPENLSWFMNTMKKRFNKSKPLIALDRLKQELAAKASGLNWTLIKPPRLTDGASSGYELAEKLKMTAFSSVSRKTIAKSIFEILENESSFEKALFIKK